VIKVKVKTECFLRGEHLGVGKVYELPLQACNELLRAGRVILHETPDFLTVRCLLDKPDEGYSFGSLMELKPAVAEDLVRSGKAEFYDPSGKDPKKVYEKVSIIPLRDTHAYIDGVNTFIDEGKEVLVDAEGATDLIQGGAAILSGKEVKIKALVSFASRARASVEGEFAPSLLRMQCNTSRPSG
jgi:hypothetical protein